MTFLSLIYFSKKHVLSCVSNLYKIHIQEKYYTHHSVKLNQCSFSCLIVLNINKLIMFLKQFTKGIALKLCFDGQEKRDILLAGLDVQISTSIGTDDFQW